MNITKLSTLKIHFETLGCKVNQIESESIARAFLDAGFSCSIGGVTSSCASDDDVLISIINTCTVTAKAEQKARRLIRLLLEKYKKSCVIVTGCYAELEKSLLENIDKRICVVKGTQKDLLADLPNEIIRYVSSEAFKSFSSQNLSLYCSSYFDKKNEKFIISPKKRSFVLSTDTFLQHSRPSIKIQDGCNNRCTYCRICLARGESVSLEPAEILKRIRLLESAQHREVIVTGINLSQYKCDGMNFTLLLSYLLANTSNIYFRISSLHPQVVTDELCAVLASERVRPHFHLSIQSGSDTILKKMARPYTALQIENAIKRLCAIKDNPFIACDIIAGFPGETEEDFEATKKLCEHSNITWIHAFPFSPRPDTLAFAMTPKTPQAVSNERVKILTDIAIKNKRNYIHNCVGKTYNGIAEKFRKKSIQIVTENFLHVTIDAASIQIPLESIGGKKVVVKIKGIAKQDLRQADGEALGELMSVDN